ncbi:MAG TPA: GatB/YqeY domain-containing protein [Acidobacteriaceae bacterium]|jgi:uncharacterized protein YqeY|nr:GatB/YqeY domain-containing protein [Acidobacteriaceae bacterium]
MATIAERVNTDIVTAMKAREEDKLTALRMVKSALKSKEIDKREPLSEAEGQGVLTILLKQRRESVEQFTKGGRPELAAKEQTEIGWIETYLPKAASEDDVRAIVSGAIEHIAAGSGGQRPGPKDIGPTMRVVQQRILASGIRADGKMVSEMVKAELAKGATADGPSEPETRTR